MGEVRRAEQTVVELDWDQAPLPCPAQDDDRAEADASHYEAALERAQERALGSIGSHLRDGWDLDGTPAEAITLKRRKRRVLLPIPDAPGEQWEEFCAATVRLRRA